MSHHHSKPLRLLAIASSSRGFGFVVLEAGESLVDWGVKAAKQDKNKNLLAKVQKLIAAYQPDVLILQDMKGSRRAPRIRQLNQHIIALAETSKLRVKLIRDKQVKQVFFGEGEGTKQERAEIIAARFPNQLSFRLPPKRRTWESEDGRMCMFDAAALALAHGFKKSSLNDPAGKAEI